MERKKRREKDKEREKVPYSLSGEKKCRKTLRTSGQNTRM
jgi:hypothetical protein